VIEGALSVVAGETVVLLVDRDRKDMATVLSDAASEKLASSITVVLEDLGARPHAQIHPTAVQQLARCQASLLFASYEPGEAQMRQELLAHVRRLKLRHADMVGVTKKSLCCGFNIEAPRIASVARAVRAKLRPGSVLSARSSTGTDLTVQCSPDHRWAERSGNIRSARVESLPAGQIMTAPGDVRGVFVCNASTGETFGARAGLLRDNPIRWTLEAGRVRSVACRDTTLERDLQAWLRAGDNRDRVGLVILGTNIGAVDPAGEIACDQILPGLHLGLGATCPDETLASWNSSSQLLLGQAYGDVDLDGVPLIRSGRYLELS
jgi:leucyl aminopeptidase (aminopeptidase T)